MGACMQGTEQFLRSIGELKEGYSIAETVRLTEGQYGADMFREFFA